jgi:hypothetical protein
MTHIKKGIPWFSRLGVGRGATALTHKTRQMLRNVKERTMGGGERKNECVEFEEDRKRQKRKNEEYTYLGR